MILARDRSQQTHTILKINILPEKISLNHTPHKIYSYNECKFTSNALSGERIGKQT